MQLDPNRDETRKRGLRVALILLALGALMGVCAVMLEARQQRDIAYILDRQEQRDTAQEGAPQRAQPFLNVRILWGYPYAPMAIEDLHDVPSDAYGLVPVRVYACGTIRNPSDKAYAFRIDTGLLAYEESVTVPRVDEDRIASETPFRVYDADIHGITPSRIVPPDTLDPAQPLEYQAVEISPHATLFVLFRTPLLVDARFLRYCVGERLADPYDVVDDAPSDFGQPYRDGDMHPYAMLRFEDDDAASEWTPIEMSLP